MVDRCENCQKAIPWSVYKYSVSVFRKALCIECQKEEREKTYPPKQAKFINEDISRRTNYERD
jgi:hypothetical protein